MPLPANLRLNAFKYPIAFIRVIELVFIIIALSSINGWFYKLKFTCPSTNATTDLERTADFTTFSFDTIKVKSCDQPEQFVNLWKEGEGFSASSGFFYFVQALALISLLAGIFLYVVLWELYTNEGRVRLGDLALTALCFILFFFCSSIWWSSSNGIGFVGSQEHVTQLLKENPHFGVTEGVQIDTKNSLLTISVLCAWVSVVLYAVNTWYIWKEITPTPTSNPTSIA
ncbi:hypothetical protein PMAYCL1PPCAC_04641 [Pristionchus mayeri]|uniref:MARVEL domain-containing protein n=1 Tax=Pristionchus mayeri TaxID=1317129 RepID=A0AAN5CAY3_9BILA|nr:hypothetical protein PMAYCL1PPCAC_04641 [Pristionchus mayeri]